MKIQREKNFKIARVMAKHCGKTSGSKVIITG